MNNVATITDVPGVAVGHWSDHRAKTGTTVLAFDSPNCAAAEIRGGDPGAREIQTLAGGMNNDGIDALVFSGGSTFGLAAADGVMAEIEKAGLGRGGTSDGFKVPLVPSVVVYDLAVGDGTVRPGPTEGAAAYNSTSTDPVEMGLIGAGAGATAAKWRGATTPGGLGSFSLSAEGARVGALVVLNAVGDVFSLEGEALSGGPLLQSLVPQWDLRERQNTTLAAVAIDAKLNRLELQRVMVRAHDAFGACLRPAHTRYDGDAVIAVATGSLPGDLDAIAEAAFVAVARAIEVAIRLSSPHLQTSA